MKKGCICQGGDEYGHLNDAGGYCCPHYGNTCGFHQNYDEARSRSIERKVKKIRWEQVIRQDQS